MLCDEKGRVAICRECDTDLHSPYWPARKSAYLHKSGTGHKVDVLHAWRLMQELETKR